MLAQDSIIFDANEPWLPYDANVYICPTKEQAKDILNQSHQNTFYPPVWTTVFRVHAQDIDVIMKDGLYWTPQASKIFVDGPVYYNAPATGSERALLARGAQIMPTIARLMQKLNTK